MGWILRLRCSTAVPRTARQLSVDGRYETLLKLILDKFKRLEEASDMVVCVGTDFSSVAPALTFDFNADLANNLGCLSLPADIAISSARTARMFGIEPRVAMLSYSTGASGKGEDVERVRAAVRIARERAPELKLEGPIQYDEPVIAAIRAMIPLAPLHNPANLDGIEVARQLLPSVPQVAVFDTAFHKTMPPAAYRYALPEHLYRNYQVRRYGFHGTSHRYVAGEAARLLGKPLEQCNLITLHLGNGASAAAIREGLSVDTSMGMTPLEGLVMGTRSGDIDPAIPFYLQRVAGMDNGQIERLLNRQSGLTGLCGANDMREIHKRADNGDEAAQLALDVTGHRLKKYIGAYYALLGRVDAVVFTGGIGENDVALRAQVCEGLQGLGIQLDPVANVDASREARRISPSDSPVPVLVIPTDEELEIARQTLSVLV